MTGRASSQCFALRRGVGHWSSGISPTGAGQTTLRSGRPPSSIDLGISLPRRHELSATKATLCPFTHRSTKISFWAWAGGSLGYISPLAHGRGNELKAILVQAAIAAI